MSDRTYKGGIQPGTTASSEKSVELDNQVKRISKELASTSKYRRARGHEKRKKLFEGIYTGCVPDGGIWFDEAGKVRAAFEAKHQKMGGNAIERHGKNYMICKAFSGEQFQYVTFCTGAGTTENGPIREYAKTTLFCENDPEHRDLNVLHPRGNSFFLSEHGFTDEEIREVMKKVLFEV
jgi:hypothetical protein